MHSRTVPGQHSQGPPFPRLGLGFLGLGYVEPWEWRTLGMVNRNLQERLRPLMLQRYRKCYYPSMKTENKCFLAFFSVRKQRWVDLLHDRLGFSVTCTVHSSNPQTADRNSWKLLQIALDVGYRCRQQMQAQCLCDCLSILTLLTLHVTNYTILLSALRLPVPVISYFEI